MIICSGLGKARNKETLVMVEPWLNNENMTDELHVYFQLKHNKEKRQKSRNKRKETEM